MNGIDPSLPELEELREVFDRNINFQGDNDRGESIFETTVSLIRLLDPIERLLVIDFLREFLVINSYDSYARLISKSIHTRFERKEKIVLIPVTDDSKSIKSSHSLIYEVKRYLEYHIDNLETVNDYTSLESRHRGFRLCFLDDFVGSGSQIRKMFRKMLNRGFSVAENAEVHIICLQQAALKRMQEFCPDIHFYEIRRRAISDSFGLSFYSTQEASRIYNNIEAKLSMRPWYKKGYGRTEALVSMKRTPNNTLPIFWQMRAKGGVEWPAIFPRKE